MNIVEATSLIYDAIDGTQFGEYEVSAENLIVAAQLLASQAPVLIRTQPGRFGRTIQAIIDSTLSDRD